ncbi:hypothetical protein [Pseudofrankia asymbiotica]|uniref:Alpha-IPM isomerase n=1 Tax=Pseudofrankia asymbiotica TaxID=1834516 RepID=A0A1V2I5I0_9ACTN|nr:hypothetical protein [Pseudofrankia asymbiotica]ONH26412.1 hypothetical protein BL253_24840 [Pseudofrankia asymbiotica]
MTTSEKSPALVREGRVWMFGDNIDTDNMVPMLAVMQSDPAEQKKFFLSEIRPGWIDLVTEGDIFVAGQNFGMGSARAIGRVMRQIGIAGLVAESINGLALRNCINFSLPALQYAGIKDLVTEGDVVRVDFSSGSITNVTTGATAVTAPLPPMLCGIVDAGGVLEMLKREGLVEVPAKG